jgi:hypothetical protein
VLEAGSHEESVRRATADLVRVTEGEVADIWWARRASVLEEYGEGGREPVQEGLAADRADLAAAEEAGHGLSSERLNDDARVVVRLGVQPGQERPGREREGIDK